MLLIAIIVIFIVWLYTGSDLTRKPKNHLSLSQSLSGWIFATRASSRHLCVVESRNLRYAFFVPRDVARAWLTA